VKLIGTGLGTITACDAQGFFEHCGYSLQSEKVSVAVADAGRPQDRTGCQHSIALNFVQSLCRRYAPTVAPVADNQVERVDHLHYTGRKWYPLPVTVRVLGDHTSPTSLQPVKAFLCHHPCDALAPDVVVRERA
jgi:hypothetical protein